MHVIIYSTTRPIKGSIWLGGAGPVSDADAGNSTYAIIREIRSVLRLVAEVAQNPTAETQGSMESPRVRFNRVYL